ncbi:murein hydrolase regulator LrgA [Virgibacillus phasianinus]|uniref:Murein hydrolase regulator LrgA n=1 Tax=Virgibacillus phasianinus TaxID=2017483 RepID=A0A220U642_9BACI|nr:CidA/LrgA family protein [Virgibacillus phasianinus]ASK63774.1 murein hydrolase regulator LrgA [Virgibacillus phasianinus]
MKKWILAIPQISLIMVFTCLGKLIVNLFPLHIPGSIVGLVLLFLSLQLGWIKLNWVETGAALLFSEMMLFFVPAVVGVMNYPWLIGMKGLLVLLVVFSGTALVMISTGVVSSSLLKPRVVKQHDATQNS